MIVDWIHVDSVPGIESILISCHGVYYMSYADDMLDDLILTFGEIKSYQTTIDKLYAEKERRWKLED